MKRPQVLARSLLAVLVALFVVGWVSSTAPSAPPVAVSTDDLDKFAAIDMGDAIARVAGPSATSDSSN